MRKKQENDVIFQAALTVFSRYGYRKTTLDEIAAELGMTGANLYAYADSKQDLYEKTVQFAFSRWQNRVLTAVRKKQTAYGQMTAMCTEAVRYLSEDREFCSLLRSDPSIFPMFPTVDPYEEINNASVSIIEGILQLGMKTGEFRKLDVSTVAQIMFTMYKSVIIQAYVCGEEDYLNEYVSQAIELVLRGVTR